MANGLLPFYAMSCLFHRVNGIFVFIEIYSLYIICCYFIITRLYLMLILEVVYLSRKNRHLLFFNYFILHVDYYFVTFAPCLTNLIMFMTKVNCTDLPSFSGCVDDCEMCPLFLNLSQCSYESSIRNFC